MGVQIGRGRPHRAVRSIFVNSSTQGVVVGGRAGQNSDHHIAWVKDVESGIEQIGFGERPAIRGSQFQSVQNLLAGLPQMVPAPAFNQTAKNGFTHNCEWRSEIGWGQHEQMANRSIGRISDAYLAQIFSDDQAAGAVNDYVEALWILWDVFGIQSANKCQT